MKTCNALGGALLCIALLAAGCSKQAAPTQPLAADAPDTGPEPALPAATPEPMPETPIVEEAPTQEPLVDEAPPPAATVASAPGAAAPPAAAVRPAPAPAAAVAPSPPPPPPAAAVPPAPAAAPAAPPPATPDIVDPGGVIAVAATKSGLTRIGAEDCGECHELQFDSWAAGPHGKRTPPLDCEHCHGPGSEYKSMSVMKDPARARAAGMVIPDKAFCAQCHKKGVTDDLMQQVHAHEE